MYEKKILRSNLKKVNNSTFDFSKENIQMLNNLLEGKKVCTYIPLSSEIHINSHLTGYSELQTTYINKEMLNVCIMQEPFVTNKFKIKEPSNIKKVVSTDIFLVPGLAFSRAGVRLGRGKGLYDKLLSKYSSSIKIGICSSKNLLDEIPKEEHDICMDYIFTENEYLKIH